MQAKKSLLWLLFLALIPLPLRADSLDLFTLTGGGHTLQFEVASTQTVVEHPHIIDLSASGPATVDGTSGYTFGLSVATQLSASPLIELSLSPLPPDIVPSPIYGNAYLLYAPLITELIADTPNPDPCLAACPNDLLTYAYLPNTYDFQGFDPAHTTLENFTLQISPETVAAAPEPPTWWLCIMGAGWLLLGCRRGGVSSSLRA